MPDNLQNCNSETLLHACTKRSRLAAMKQKKNPAAVALGRQGGLARAEKTAKQKLSEIGRKGAAARWKKAKQT